MKITIKQLRKIIKEELENTLANSNADNIDIEWGKGKVEDSEVTYPVIIASGDFKVRTWVSYDYDSIDEPTCSMTEEGNFNYIGNEELENNMSEEEFFATLQKLENAVLKQAVEKEFIEGAKDDIENHLSDQRDSEELSRDPDAYYGVKGQFR